MIYFDDNHMKIGSVILPGIYKSIEITQEAQVDEQEVEGSSKKPKQATGYEDSKITIELVLDTSENQTINEKLQIIQNIFKRPEQTLPEVYPIINEHTAIRGITQVIFKKLASKETNKKDEVTVSIEFWEYVAMTIAASSGSADNKGSTGSSGSTLTSKYKSYASNSRGASPKTNKSPAQDDPAWRPYYR